MKILYVTQEISKNIQHVRLLIDYLHTLSCFPELCQALLWPVIERVKELVLPIASILKHERTLIPC